MRKLLILLILGLFANYLPAQNNFGIQAVSLVKPNPTINDSIELRINAVFSTLHSIEEVLDTLVGDQLQLEIHYCGGALTAIDMREDTFRLAPLPLGTYALNVRVLQKDLDMVDMSCHPRDTFNLSIPFTVSLINSTNDILNARIEIYPNPASELVQINANRNIESLGVFNLNGQEILRTFPNSNQYQWSIPDLGGGKLFLLQIQLSNGANLVRKLYLN